MRQPPVGSSKGPETTASEDLGVWSRRGFVKAGAGFVSLAAGGGLLAACGSSDDSSDGSRSGSGDGDVTFGFSHPFAEIPVVATVKQRIKNYGEEEGWKVLLDETQAGELQDQLNTLDTWITQRITAMNVTAADPSTLEATAMRAIDRGVTWTTYGFPMKNAAGGILFPPDLSGEVTGKATVEWIEANDPTAEVLVLELPAGGPARARTDIPQKMIRDQTNAKIVAVQGGAEQTSGLQVTKDILKAHPNLSVVVCHNDDGGLGASKAFKQAGRTDVDKVWIIGQDGSEDALNALKAGNTFFKASAALDIDRLCRDVIAVAKYAIEKQPDWKPGDKQHYPKLAPTLIKVGDTALINRFLATFKS